MRSQATEAPGKLKDPAGRKGETFRRLLSISAMRTPTGILGCFLALLATAPLTAATPAVGPPLAVPRTAGRITLDGRLDDAAWQTAAVLDTFYETYPADNTEPAAKTVVYL